MNNVVVRNLPLFITHLLWYTLSWGRSRCPGGDRQYLHPVLCHCQLPRTAVGQPIRVFHTLFSLQMPFLGGNCTKTGVPEQLQFIHFKL